MTAALPDDVAYMEGEGALPRDNGELVFEAPWQARAVALAVTLVQEADLPWDAFRLRLIDAIGHSPDRPYYESWAVALEVLAVDLGLVTPSALDAATPAERASL